jgi:hypothetical protein
MNKIKWYDYIAAILLSDVILTFIIAAILSASFVSGFFYGVIISVLWEFWKAYCNYRKENDIFKWGGE